MMKKLTIVLPCYNEQENIPRFFPELLSFAEKNNFNVIAVNDGSTDETLSILQQFKTKHPNIMEVLSHAVDTPFAITIDADGQHRLDELMKCFECIEKNNADMVVGARQNNESGRYRTLGKWMIRAFATSLLKLPVQDLNSGMKCYRMSETRSYLELCPDTMAFSDVILLLMVNDRKLVLETPIFIEARTAGKSTIGTRTALVTVTEILNLAVLLRPLTTFLRLGIFFVLLGVIWGTFIYMHSTVITSSAVMFIVLGMLSFMLGLLCEQLSKIRKLLAKKVNKDE